jgi:hypothetical protein
MTADTLLDKNWYAYPANDLLPLDLDWDEDDFASNEHPERHFTDFPRNVDIVVAQKQDEDGTSGLFRLLNGVYVFFFVDCDKTYREVTLMRSLQFQLYGFDLEHVNWRELLPETPDPVFDHPIFDLNDEV